VVLGGGITMTAVERAIESLAALVGKSYIKEEIVHGSYRCVIFTCTSRLEYSVGVMCECRNQIWFCS
jgi:hypothetical protein